MRRQHPLAVWIGRRRSVPTVAAMVAVAATLVGCSLGTHSSDAGARQPTFVTSGPGDTSSASPSPAAPTPPKASSTKPSKKPTKKPSAKATKTETIPPPPGCAGYQGKNLSKTAVKDLLTTAAQRQPWVGIQQPANLTKPLPKIAVPLKLLKAIAAQETGWQTACKSNDGQGFGLFQISADTESFVNQRFGESYDRFKPADNVAIATDNLAWLVEYFGQFHFHETFSWSNNDLLNAVVASFNVGYGAVDGDNKITIPDYAWGYVDAVREQEQPDADCQQWG